MKQVYVTTITHKHGNNVYVNQTRVGATKTVASYARKWWKERFNNAPMPKHDKLVIERYFNMDECGFGDGEFYMIDACEVNP